MKKIFVLLLAAALVLTGCGKEETLVGIWEQEITVSVLGAQDWTETEGIVRFTFREDGTGAQEQIILDGIHPDAVRDFTWKLEETGLTLFYPKGQTDTFDVTLKDGTLQLKHNRGSFDLTRAAK